MWVLRIPTQVLGPTQQVLLATEPSPKAIPAVIFKNENEALLKHSYCDLKGWHAFCLFVF